MKKSRIIAAAAGAALLAGLVGAPGAQAEDTTVTFTVTAGSLTLAIASESGALGNVATNVAGSIASGSIGTMTVSDQRGSLAGWTLTASMAGPFQAVNGSGVAQDRDGDGSTADDVIPCTAAKVTTPATATTTGAIAVFTGNAAGVTLTDTGSDGDCDGNAIASATSLGSHSAEFATTIAVTVPATALAGAYQGTLTQTVA